VVLRGLRSVSSSWTRAKAKSVNDARAANIDGPAFSLGRRVLLPRRLKMYRPAAQHLINELDVELSALTQPVAIAVQVFDS